MQKFLFLFVLAMLNLPLFAQSFASNFGHSEPQTTKSLFTKTVSAPDRLFATKGEPWDKGFFMDLIWGMGTETYSVPSVPNNPGYPVSSQLISQTSLRLGSKWYFGSGEKFKPGIQAVWARIGVATPLVFGVVTNPNSSLAKVSVNGALLNIGSTNLFVFNENIGMEANFNIGLNSSFSFVPVSNGNQTVMQFGVLINPVIKFRYKKFAVGFDIAYTHYPAPGQVFQSAQDPVPFLYEAGVFVFGLTVGLKF